MDAVSSLPQVTGEIVLSREDPRKAPHLHLRPARRGAENQHRQ